MLHYAYIACLAHLEVGRNQISLSVEERELVCLSCPFLSYGCLFYNFRDTL